jgi:gas vesicle protein
MAGRHSKEEHGDMRRREMSNGYGNEEGSMSSGYGGADSPGSGTAFFTGLLAGAVIGGSLGLLFAPRKGSELREQVADSASSVGKTVSRTVDELADRGRDVYARARDVVARTGDEIDRVAGEATNRVDKGLTAVADAAAAKSRRVDQYVADRS